MGSAGGVRLVGGRVGGGRGGCERRTEVFVKIKKKKQFGGVRGGGQDGCDRRIEVFGKIHKKNRVWGGGGSGWGQGGCE